MKPETYELAKQNFEAHVESSPQHYRPVPTTRIGWFIRLHFTDTGRISTWDAVKQIRAENSTEPEEPPASEPYPGQ